MPITVLARKTGVRAASCPALGRLWLLPNTALGFLGFPLAPSGPQRVLLLGAALGHGTNNLGEIYAVGLCLQALLLAARLHSFHEVAIFTDSKYTLQALSSRSLPASNTHAVLSVRALLNLCSRAFQVSLCWLKGHAGIPGNALADSIAGHFSPISPSPISPSPTFSEPALLCGSVFAPSPLLPTPATVFFASSPSPSSNFSCPSHFDLTSLRPLYLSGIAAPPPTHFVPAP